MQAEGTTTRTGWPGILLVWAVALAGAIAVIVVAFSGTTDWFGDSTRLGVYGALGTVFAASVLLTLVVQLSSRRPHGFVGRTSSSIGGAAVALGVAALVVAPVVAA